jgi:thioredoxin reductase (NADPH)
VLTIEELASVPLLSPLSAAELEQLARRAADIHLAPGEYAVHEGDERALFVVLAGKIEVTKRIDGIERTIGWRTPGQIFGEVPLALGGPFLGGMFACGDVRSALVKRVASAVGEGSMAIAFVHQCLRLEAAKQLIRSGQPNP